MTATGLVPPRRPRLRALAVLAGGGALLEVVGALALMPLANLSWARALDAFLVTNALMGASFALSGLLIAWHRPVNPLGWLLIAGGVGHATSAFLAPLSLVVADAGGPDPLVRALVTGHMVSWPWSIALFLPLALLLFPDGRLPSPRWGYAVVVIVATAPLFVLEMVTDPAPGWLWTLAELRTLGALLVALAALVARYRTAGETERRQLLWLLLAATVVVVAVAPWAFVAGTPVVVLLAIPLVPLAVAVAVIRHQVLDIRLVLSRAVAWALLSVAALVAYVGVVAVLDTFVSRTLGRSALATVVVALAVAPVLPRLQRTVDRWLYGDRHDPARVAGRLAEHLTGGTSDGPAEVVTSLGAALRLPYVALHDATTELAAVGTPGAHTVTVPLEYAGDPVGRLVVGLRPGERRLAAADEATLQLVCVPLAVAVRALVLTAELGTTREHERRRLRRDLHDGLGPTLTGLALAADAGVNVLDRDPELVRELLGTVQRDARLALADVRRLVDNLTPPTLGRLGLVGALERRADQFRSPGRGAGLDVRLVVPAPLPVLPERVEVAAYRIATEALLNIARHADATCATVEVRCDETTRSLHLVVTDDGRGTTTWAPGVGLEAMRERAAELGGGLEAGPTSAGGRVCVSIPVPS